MRIKIIFSKNTEKVTNNQSIVNSYIHKCLGYNNKYHDNKSNYCISGLLGGEIINDGKYSIFKNGGFILITSLDLEFINKIIIGVINNPDLGFGMKFIRIDSIDEKFYNGWNYFKTTNIGFLLKEQNIVNKNIIYYTLNNKELLLEKLKSHIINKFKKINNSIDFTDLNLEIIDHESHKVRRIFVKNVSNFVNICQINIFTNKNLANLIYNYGLGQSTGCGFGTVYTTINHKFYN